jgi:hypothetical protein
VVGNLNHRVAAIVEREAKGAPERVERAIDGRIAVTSRERDHEPPTLREFPGMPEIEVLGPVRRGGYRCKPSRGETFRRPCLEGQPPAARDGRIDGGATRAHEEVEVVAAFGAFVPNHGNPHGAWKRFLRGLGLRASRIALHSPILAGHCIGVAERGSERFLPLFRPRTPAARPYHPRP